MGKLLNYTDEQVIEAYEFYMSEPRNTLKDAAKRLGVNPISLRERFKEMGLERKPKMYGRRKEFYVDKNGYYFRRLYPNDPMFEMAGANNRVLYHRYVMALYLGRPLTEYETVHHIDGDRSNNDITNLQLRIGNHGRGQPYECADCGSRRLNPVEID